MSEKELRVTFGQNAALDMAEYAPEKVIELWRRLIVETVGENK